MEIQELLNHGAEGELYFIDPKIKLKKSAKEVIESLLTPRIE